MIPISSFVWLLILAVATAAFVRHIRIPYTVALVAVGLVASSFGLLANVRPNAAVILLVFLPPLLFEAAAQLDVHSLGRALPVILALAIPGVALSTLLIGFSLSLLTPLTIWCALLFGAFISATDPVAVVSMFRRLGAPPTLTAAIEGESLFNDGTALVLSTLLVVAARTGHFNLGTTFLLFLWSVAAAVGIGLGSGYLVSEMMRFVDDPFIITTVSAALAYGSYLLADQVGASGVIAVVLAGLVFRSHGTAQHVSPEARRVLHDFWVEIGFLANAILFILIGLSIHLDRLWRHAVPVLIAIGVVLAARALIVYPVALASRRLAANCGNILFWAGLRGGAALAVALSLSPAIPQRSLLLTMTFGVVLFTILVQGITIEPLAQWLGVIPSRPSFEGLEREEVRVAEMAHDARDFKSHLRADLEGVEERIRERRREEGE